jgi:putative oxygen-independent coproporphyrinogen III oxidase
VSPPGAAGLYLHVPFCSAVCPYCDFAVLRDDPRLHESYLEALLREAEARVEELGGAEIDTIYFGGGTPSALSPDHLGRLIEGLHETLPLRSDARLHFEANPEDIDEDVLAQWGALGLHFLSLGIQSFRDAELRFLGRRHDGAQARRALERALASGIHTVSCDLIFGLPEQSPEDLRANVEVVAAMKPGHVSGYQLTIEARTPFGRRVAAGRWAPLPDPEQGRLFDELHEGLAAAGYEAYEVSNFRLRPEHASRHNEKYWDRAPYLGLGPSAHSFDGRRRSWNRRDLSDWRRAVMAGEGAVADREDLSSWDLIAESLMLGLRRPQGIDTAALRAASGWDLLTSGGPALERALAHGHLHREGRFIRPSRRGMAIADALARDLCPDPS